MPSTRMRSAGQNPPQVSDPHAVNREGRRLRVYPVALMIAAAVVGFTQFASPTAPAGATPTTPFSRGAPIPLGPGISLTPADGWTILNGQQTDNEVILQNADQTAVLDVTVGAGDSNDPAQELNQNVQQFVQRIGFTNVMLATPDSGPLDSRFFQKRVTQGFTANDSAPPGAPHKGILTELINTASRMAAFAAFVADPGAYDAASDDATNMINSML